MAANSCDCRSARCISRVAGASVCDKSHIMSLTLRLLCWSQFGSIGVRQTNRHGLPPRPAPPQPPHSVAASSAAAAARYDSNKESGESDCEDQARFRWC